jgi:GH24 family phage-related lysozyme (muramidase)
MNKILLLCLISFALSARSVSQTGINLIKQFEGCRLQAYQDSVGVWTIGYGTTSADKSITGTNIYSGLSISQATAENWLRKSLNNKYAPLVNKYDSKYKWTQNEFDALISFAYNIGSIDQLTASGSRSRATIASKMLEYCHAGGKKLEGLVRRRQAEHDLFVKH